MPVSPSAEVTFSNTVELKIPNFWLFGGIQDGSRLKKKNKNIDLGTRVLNFPDLKFSFKAAFVRGILVFKAIALL